MIENTITTDSFSSQTEFSTQSRFPMLTVTLCQIQMRMIITDQEHLLDSRSTWYCLTDLGEGVGSSNPKMLLPLLKRKELDSKTFTNDEIILGNFKGKESLPLANRGNTFVSLRGVLEVLSKTELSSDTARSCQNTEPSKRRKPLAPTHKSKGFSFCRRQVDTGLCRFLRRQRL